jgi:hypothetical protein
MSPSCSAGHVLTMVDISHAVDVDRAPPPVANRKNITGGVNSVSGIDIIAERTASW